VCRGRQTAELSRGRHSTAENRWGGTGRNYTGRALPATSYAATALMNSSPLPVADTAHVRSFAYVPAPIMEVSPVSQDERERGRRITA
jgi:hypothetical protein